MDELSSIMVTLSKGRRTKQGA